MLRPGLCAVLILGTVLWLSDMWTLWKFIIPIALPRVNVGFLKNELPGRGKSQVHQISLLPLTFMEDNEDRLIVAEQMYVHYVGFP